MTGVTRPAEVLAGAMLAVAMLAVAMLAGQGTLSWWTTRPGGTC